MKNLDAIKQDTQEPIQELGFRILAVVNDTPENRAALAQVRDKIKELVNYLKEVK